MWNLPISQSGIWNLSIQSFKSSDVCMMGATMRIADTAHASRRTANIAELIAATQEEPRRTLSSLG